MQITTLAEEPGWEKELQAFLNLSLAKDFFTEHMFNRIMKQDPNMDARFVYLAIDGGRLIGALIGVRRTKAPEELVELQKEVGWIKALAVHPEKKGLKIADELLKAYEDALLKEGRKFVRVSDFASWHVTAGLDISYEHLLEAYYRNGYAKAGQAVDYEIDLTGFQIPAYVKRYEKKLLENGFKIYRPVPEEEEEVTAWVKKVFSPFWAYEARMAFRNPEPTIWIAKKDGEIAGFSVYSALEPEWFGPIGVDPEKRGKGLGTVLLYKSLLSMRLLGERLIVIPWTEHLFFYTQLSRTVGIRHYLILSKNLKP